MAKLGTAERPAVIHVRNMIRAEEMFHLCESRGWKVIVGMEPDKTEDISDVERLMNPPPPAAKAVTLGRNDPYHCGSGKKYKHCCMRIDLV